MPTIFVARSVKAGKWASDVGLGKHLYKVGVTDGRPEGSSGRRLGRRELDWSIVKAEPVRRVG